MNIKQKAKNYSYGNSLEYIRANPFTCMEYAYIDGAIAVLEVIEKYIGNNSSLETEFIKDKIKELKGE